MQNIENVAKTLLRQSRHSRQYQNELNRYFNSDTFANDISIWKYWKNHESIFSNLTQMIRNVLVCSITSVSIKRTFSMIKKVCHFDRMQMNLKTVEEFMIIKHYNCKTDHTKNDIFVEFWNIMSKAKNDDRKFNEYKDSFKISLRKILFNMRYLKSLKVWCTRYLLDITILLNEWTDNANK